MARTFRSLVRFLVPSWLNSGDGEKVLFTLALLIDAHTQRILDGLNARFPSRANPTANALTGQDRGIIRGRIETNAHYAERLKRWRYPRGHRTRGSAFALLEQIGEYWGSLPCWTIDVNGNRHDRDANGVESYSYGETWAWDTGAAEGRYRFWAGLDGTGVLTASPDWGDAALWGGGGDAAADYTIGQVGAMHEDERAMRRLMQWRAWKPAGTQPEWLVISLDGTEPTPDATYTEWSYLDTSAPDGVGVQRPSRSSSQYRYWSFDPAYNNTYGGDSTNFPVWSELVDGVYYDEYGGHPPLFPSEILLPNGEMYAGDPASFLSSVQLIDDGDVPDVAALSEDVQVFTSSDNWVLPPFAEFVQMIVVAGGGDGGDAPDTAHGGAGGGGAGQIVVGYYAAGDIPPGIAVVDVGVAGAASSVRIGGSWGPYAVGGADGGDAPAGSTGGARSSSLSRIEGGAGGDAGSDGEQGDRAYLSYDATAGYGGLDGGSYPGSGGWRGKGYGAGGGGAGGSGYGSGGGGGGGGAGGYVYPPGGYANLAGNGESGATGSPQTKLGGAGAPGIVIIRTLYRTVT